MLSLFGVDLMNTNIVISKSTKIIYEQIQILLIDHEEIKYQLTPLITDSLIDYEYETNSYFSNICLQSELNL